MDGRSWKKGEQPISFVEISANPPCCVAGGCGAWQSMSDSLRVERKECIRLLPPDKFPLCRITSSSADDKEDAMMFGVRPVALIDEYHRII